MTVQEQRDGALELARDTRSAARSLRARLAGASTPMESMALLADAVEDWSPLLHRLELARVLGMLKGVGAQRAEMICGHVGASPNRQMGALTRRQRGVLVAHLRPESATHSVLRAHASPSLRRLARGHRQILGFLAAATGASEHELDYQRAKRHGAELGPVAPDLDQLEEAGLVEREVRVTWRITSEGRRSVADPEEAPAIDEPPAERVAGRARPRALHTGGGRRLNGTGRSE